jgi:hypothetical protein
MAEFVTNYPRKLVFHVTLICEPPMAGWYDFTLGPGLDGLVAKYYTEGGDPDDMYARVPCGFKILDPTG